MMHWTGAALLVVLAIASASAIGSDLRSILLSYNDKNVLATSNCTTKTCNGDQTCCHDDWDCCPVPDAVCCKDKGHCCPHGYICDDQPFICRWPDDDHRIKSVEYKSSHTVVSVNCDANFECPDGNTCCKMADGSWGCCPVKGATCCDDHIHCCAQGSTCDTAQGRCNSNSGLSSTSWVTKVSAKKRSNAEMVKSVRCDASHVCPNGNTCCKTDSNEWGCCPLPNAVCCDDHEHCCPNGYTCQTSSGECVRGLTSIPWLAKAPATVTEVKAIHCDNTHECPDENTCCKLESGEWGCCPSPRAVCCDDHKHCCPNGYTCQTGTGECMSGLESIPWLTKQPSISNAVEVEAVRCDATHECPSGNTCCKLASGQWGCCPIPNAVCCSDHEHCCPSGYTCDSGRCSRGLESIPWLAKQPSISSAVEVENVRCDATHECPSGNTCCKLASGQWGCCPIPNAVCCSDHEHCCPSGYTCDSGRCSRGLQSVPLLATELTFSKVIEAVRCDATHACPSGNTCCKLSSGQWGCCPIPNAVCCSDHEHCCPSGYTCDSGRCSKGLESIPWLTKQPSTPSEINPEEGYDVISWMNKKPAVKSAPTNFKSYIATFESVRCDDEFECPDSYTCCRMDDDRWGCCPYIQAVCCSDGLHCCPNGYTCDPGNHRCLHRQDGQQAYKQLIAAVTRQ